MIVGVQINPAVQSHRRSLLCVTTQATREGNPSRAEGPVRGISFMLEAADSRTSEGTETVQFRSRRANLPRSRWIDCRGRVDAPEHQVCGQSKRKQSER